MNSMDFQDIEKAEENYLKDRYEKGRNQFHHLILCYISEYPEKGTKRDKIIDIKLKMVELFNNMVKDNRLSLTFECEIEIGQIPNKVIIELKRNGNGMTIKDYEPDS